MFTMFSNNKLGNVLTNTKRSLLCKSSVLWDKKITSKNSDNPYEWSFSITETPKASLANFCERQKKFSISFLWYPLCVLPKFLRPTNRQCQKHKKGPLSNFFFRYGDSSRQQVFDILILIIPSMVKTKFSHPTDGQHRLLAVVSLFNY